MKLFKISTITLFILFLSGCGQYGPLYLSAPTPKQEVHHAS